MPDLCDALLPFLAMNEMALVACTCRASARGPWAAAVKRTCDVSQRYMQAVSTYHVDRAVDAIGHHCQCDAYDEATDTVSVLDCVRPEGKKHASVVLYMACGTCQRSIKDVTTRKTLYKQLYALAQDTSLLAGADEVQEVQEMVNDGAPPRNTVATTREDVLHDRARRNKVFSLIGDCFTLVVPFRLSCHLFYRRPFSVGLFCGTVRVAVVTPCRAAPYFRVLFDPHSSAYRFFLDALLAYPQLLAPVLRGMGVACVVK